jgi:hypothetical protein
MGQPSSLFFFLVFHSLFPFPPYSHSSVSRSSSNSTGKKKCKNGGGKK